MDADLDAELTGTAVGLWAASDSDLVAWIASDAPSKAKVK